MLTAIPKHWYSWNFTLTDGERTLADIVLSSWRERGALTVGGASYRIYRDGLLGPFVLESHNGVIARATKPSALRRTFVLEHGGREYELKKTSAFRRRFALFAGSEEIGSVEPEGVCTRRSRVDLPANLPDAVKAFIMWLTLVIWKRDASSGS